LLADNGWHNDFSYDGRDEIGLTSKKCPQFYTMTPLAAAQMGERRKGKGKREKGKEQYGGISECKGDIGKKIPAMIAGILEVL
jgi:hypothetical protein